MRMFLIALHPQHLLSQLLDMRVDMQLADDIVFLPPRSSSSLLRARPPAFSGGRAKGAGVVSKGPAQAEARLSGDVGRLARPAALRA